MHYHWLQAHVDLVESFSLPVGKLLDREQSVRLAALQRGFVRVSFEQVSARVVTEFNRQFLMHSLCNLLRLLADRNIDEIELVIPSVLPWPCCSRNRRH